ncbi:hypothetical protein BCR44DRAFT_1429576 [Catenaria anguillulae PL171]|uniref:DNA repair protein REV1 n=1 Tax=Catenaria anguillulae PL171 TaxID=765915 RepID=A0A1Y2HU27_9FUNG|nr:hypothetical protein BCR44DRAFT_1429576 [Catenaria anguillulae PL171]
MSQKRHKLYAQDALDRDPGRDDAQVGSASSSRPIFAGMSIHINGYVQEVTQQELKDLILQHGGRFDHYLSKSGTTHIVASNLTEAKKIEFRRYKVASPKWILDCVAQGKLLPWHQYSVLASAGTTLYDMGHARRPKSPKTSEPVAPAPKAAAASPPPPHAPPPKTASPNRLSVFNAATDPDSFLTSYYQNSRLSDASFQEARTLAPAPSVPHRVIFHVDMDSFFASVTLRDRPDLRTLPVAVSHSAVARDDSTSEIASCNYIARGFGVRNGMFVAQAKQLCPALVLVPYAFEQYKQATHKVYAVLMDVADNLQAVSCDEAYVDVSSRIGVPATPEKILQVANDIRARIQAAKPNGAVWWTREDFLRERSEIQVGDMPGVGRKMGRRLKEMGVETCLDVVTKVGKVKLMRELGAKVGQTLFDACEGVDTRTFGHRARQTVSGEVNYGIRFKSVQEAHTFLTKLSNEVSQRLSQIGAQTSHLTLKLMFLGHGICDSHSRSVTLPSPTDLPHLIAQHVISLLDAMAFPPADLRGIGISCTRLVGGEAEEVQGGYKQQRDGVDLRKMFGRVAAAATKGQAREQKIDGLGSSDDTHEENQDVVDKGLDRVGSHGAGSSLSCASAAGGIDWAVFNDLPPDIQAELRQQWKVGEPVRELMAKEKAGAGPAKLWKGKGKQKAQVDGHHTVAHASEITDEQVEQAFFKMWTLPSYIRAELLAEKRRDLESEAAARLVALQLTPPTVIARDTPITLDSDTDSDSGAADTRSDAKINNVLTPPTASLSTTSTSPPSLLGRSDLPSIRSLLRDWITHTAHHATETDVDTDAEFVAQYAEALVEDGWMDWAKMVVQWLKYLVDVVIVREQGPTVAGATVDVIRQLIARVEDRVQAKVRQVTHGGELMLDEW